MIKLDRILLYEFLLSSVAEPEPEPEPEAPEPYHFFALIRTGIGIVILF
jgi:hypothetical protein